MNVSMKEYLVYSQIVIETSYTTQNKIIHVQSCLLCLNNNNTIITCILNVYVLCNLKICVLSRLCWTFSEHKLHTTRLVSFPDHSGRVLVSRLYFNSVWCFSSYCKNHTAWGHRKCAWQLYCRKFCRHHAPWWDRNLGSYCSDQLEVKLTSVVNTNTAKLLS